MLMFLHLTPETKYQTLEIYEDWLTPEQYKTIFDSDAAWYIVKVGDKVEIFQGGKHEADSNSH